MELQNISGTLPASTFSACFYHVKMYSKTTQLVKQRLYTRVCFPLCLKSTFKVEACVFPGFKTKAKEPGIFSQPFKPTDRHKLALRLHREFTTAGRSREIRINSTNSPASGAGTSQHGLMLLFWSVREVMCA